MDAMDARELHLAVTPDNPAHALYRRLGFRKKSRTDAPPA
jgi:ribosomal protein S18 acetylase RimI-like enzyme